jgi:hypothetical protein
MCASLLSRPGGPIQLRARRAARHHLPAHHCPPAVALGTRRNTIRWLLALRKDGLLLSQICYPKVGGIASNAWNNLSIRVSNGRMLNKNIHTNCERIIEFIDHILSILPR